MGSNDQEAEDVSLCDLPLLNSIEEEKEAKTEASEAQEDFAFGVVGDASLLPESEMCVADEVFFRGQILPLRLSVSSENCLTRKENRSVSTRSESLDRSSLTGFRSSCSRSSSCSTASSSAAITFTRVASESRLRNQFHAHPSPKPQIRVSSARLERVSSCRKPKSSMWDFFRIGLVRTPEIELQELKAFRSNSRGNKKGPLISPNGSINSENNNISSSINHRADHISNAEKQKRGKFLFGCKCAVDTVGSNSVMIKSKGDQNTTIIDENDNSKHAIKEKQKKMIKNHNKKKKQEVEKQVMSHHRTYEWLKDLSHAHPSLHV
ncbi:hypothetical protein UlMin_039079 [Ulmus minor]